jgi:hypothetical protein
VARRKSAESMSLSGEKTVAVALLTHTEIGPSSRSTWSAACSTASGWLTSTGSASGVPPAARTSSAAPSSPAWPRARSATRHPSFANSLAVARPTPADAPVTTTTRS